MTDPASPTAGVPTDVQAAVVDTSGEVVGVTLTWGTSAGSLTNVIGMTLLSGSTYRTSASIPGQVGGQVIYYRVTAEGPTQTNQSTVKSYTIPGGQYVLLPVATYIWTFFPPCAELNCAKRIINKNFLSRTTEVFARIDGVPVRNLASHVVRADRSNPVFLVDAGPIGEGGYGGILPALQGGYWLMLKPLSPGVHRISFGATVSNIDPNTGQPLDGTFKLDAKLTLKVKHCGRRRSCAH